MGRLLKIVGGGWALLGVYSCYRTFSPKGDGTDIAAQDMTGLGVVAISAFLLCILPGVMVMGIGYMVSKKATK